MSPAPRFLQSGDTCLIVELGDAIDLTVSRLVLALMRRVEDAAVTGIVEMVPTFRSLSIHYDPLRLPRRALLGRLEGLCANLEAVATAGRRWRIPVCYAGDLAPDLEDVARRTGLTADQVVEAHSSLSHHVYMLGFLPGLPYLGDLPERLALPRRESPRVKVPAGSVAIAMAMTVIYPLESPGGWHLIGRTPVPLWDIGRQPPVLLASGDTVHFVPVTRARFDALEGEVRAGRQIVSAEARAA